MRRYAVLVATCGLAFAAAPAHATVTVDATSFDSAVVADPNGPYTSIGFTDAGLSPSFSEFVTFTNTLGGLYNIDANSSSRFTTFTSGILSLAGSTVASLQPLVTNGTQYWRTTNVALNPGQYTLTLNGTVSMDGSQQPPGVAGGSIAIRPVVSALPEPATWAMMLIGFGAVGYAVRRRRTPAGRGQLRTA